MLPPANMDIRTEIFTGDSSYYLDELKAKEYRFAMTFLDPPFNQGKEYSYWDDNLPEETYWEWMRQICHKILHITLEGGALYFMQREKNMEHVLSILRQTGWVLQNIIVWTKRTSAVPNSMRFGKQYQFIAFATKGRYVRLFNRLRIDAPLRPEYKQPRNNGIFVTDVWDDIRELTSGYFAGDEAIRTIQGMRFHKQQSPIALLTRIILSSTMPGDWVLDPFAGTGTTAVVSRQLERHSASIEIDHNNVACIRKRLNAQRPVDSVDKLKQYYRFTPQIHSIWSTTYNQ